MSLHLANRGLISKHERLNEFLAGLDSVIVAFSGGVDSALVLKVAHDVLGEQAVAATADSPALPRAELAIAEEIAGAIGVRHLIVRTEEMQVSNYRENPVNRCYFCKSELYSKLLEIAEREAITAIANGTNLDDLGDYRPGLHAADEFRVVSPLKEAQMTKEDVRRLARMLGLPVWDKPASPCLASRIPYGRPVTAEKLAMIEAAEAHLKGLAIPELRVRHFGLTARIEVRPQYLGCVRENLPEIGTQLKALGFEEIELAEFKSGSLNSILKG